MKITLAKVLESLSHDTLSFMADSNHARGSIVGAQIPKVISRVNSVLRRLNVKFTLSEKRVRINLETGRRYYPLTVGASWIVSDPDEPFIGDVSRILSIETSNGRVHDLNDVAKHNSILLRDEGKSLVVDSFVPTGPAVVTFKANTPQFDLDVENLTQEIEIPEALLNALYLGVAAISYEGIGGAENISMAMAKWKQYEAECVEAKINSAVEVEEFEDKNTFADRGFR